MTGFRRLNKFDQLAAIRYRFENIKSDCNAAQVSIEEIAKFLQAISAILNSSGTAGTDSSSIGSIFNVEEKISSYIR